MRCLPCLLGDAPAGNGSQTLAVPAGLPNPLGWLVVAPADHTGFVSLPSTIHEQGAQS